MKTDPPGLHRDVPHGGPVVLIAGSAGAIEALFTILGSLPRGFPAPVVIVQHRRATPLTSLAKVLGRKTGLPVVDAETGTTMQPGTVYVARPDRHLVVGPLDTLEYIDGRRIRHVLSSANPLFESSARVLGKRVIAVVLSGSGMDATDGVQEVKAHGGIVIAQDTATARHFAMPRAAIATGSVDYVLPVEAIGPMLTSLVCRRLPTDV